MNKYKIVSYFTQNTVYEDIARTHLIYTLTGTNLDWEVSSIKNEGDWYKNTAMKPRFIYEQLCSTDKDIVWIDADAKIMQPVVLFDEIPASFDIALHYLEWDKHYKRRYDKTKELLTGTVYFRNSLKVKNLVNKWAIQCAQNLSIWEQKILEKMIANSGLSVYNLPVQYCAIIDREGNIPDYIQNPVIVHYQASRTVRKHSI